MGFLDVAEYQSYFVHCTKLDLPVRHCIKLHLLVRHCTSSLHHVTVPNYACFYITAPRHCTKLHLLVRHCTKLHLLAHHCTTSLHQTTPACTPLHHVTAPNYTCLPCPSTISSHLQPTQAATGGSAQLLRAPGEGPCTSQPDPDPSIGLCAQLMRGPSEAPPTSQPGTDPSIGFCAQLMRGLSEAPPTSQPGTDPSSDGSQGDEEVEEVEEVGSQSLPGIYMPSPILEQMMVLPLVLFGGRVLEQGLGVVCEEPAPPSAWPELREIEIGSLDRGTAHDEAQIYMPAGQGLPGGSMEVDHEIGICGEDLDHSSRGSQLTGMVESVAHWGGSSREALLLSLEGLHRHSQQSREAGSDAVGSALDAQHAAMQVLMLILAHWSWTLAQPGLLGCNPPLVH
eukprot:1161944-Pelagomonas_calceolata.AAC.7